MPVVCAAVLHSENLQGEFAVIDTPGCQCALGERKHTKGATLGLFRICGSPKQTSARAGPPEASQPLPLPHAACCTTTVGTSAINATNHRKDRIRPERMLLCYRRTAAAYRWRCCCCVASSSVLLLARCCLMQYRGVQPSHHNT